MSPQEKGDGFSMDLWFSISKDLRKSQLFLSILGERVNKIREALVTGVCLPVIRT